MDEEDGRLGPRARQTGRVDVLRDALMMSLCHLPKNFNRVSKVSKLRPELDLRTFKEPTKSEVMS